MLLAHLAHAVDPLTPEQTAAVERAQRELQGSASPSLRFTLVSIEAREWPDTSLGCRKPGAAYLQVISPGYRVLLSDGEKTHEVHVAGDRAVICHANGLRAPRARATQLPRLEQFAREDLASKLGVPVDTIRVTQRVPKRWSEATLECREPAEGASAEIAGFKLYLRYRRRIYTYHTDDDSRVVACPSIATR